MEQVTQHRTQIYLPGGLYQKVKKIAKRTDTTLAEVIRSALRDLDEVKQLSGKSDSESGWKLFIKRAEQIDLPSGMVKGHDDDWGLVD